MHHQIEPGVTTLTIFIFGLSCSVELLIAVIKANGSSVLISASLEPTGRLWKHCVLSLFFIFFIFFLQPHGKRGDEADPHTLPRSREEHPEPRAEPRPKTNCCSSLQQELLERHQRETQSGAFFWKEPSLSLILELVLSPGGSRLLREGF